MFKVSNTATLFILRLMLDFFVLSPLKCDEMDNKINATKKKNKCRAKLSFPEPIVTRRCARARAVSILRRRGCCSVCNLPQRRRCRIELVSVRLMRQQHLLFSSSFPRLLLLQHHPTPSTFSSTSVILQHHPTLRSGNRVRIAIVVAIIDARPRHCRRCGCIIVQSNTIPILCSKVVVRCCSFRRTKL